MSIGEILFEWKPNKLNPFSWDAEAFDIIGLATFAVLLFIGVVSTDPAVEKFRIFFLVIGGFGLLVDGYNVSRWVWRTCWRDGKCSMPIPVKWLTKDVNLDNVQLMGG